MSERISGISIGLDMDSVGLERTLSSIKDSFREVRSAARTNINNIKYDDKNIKTYKGHVDELSKTFDAQKKNVDDLKKQYDMLEQSGKANTQEGQRLRNEINKQVDEFNRLGHELDQAKDKMQELYTQDSGFTKIGNAMDASGQKMQAFGGQVQRLGGSLTKWITAPALGAVTAIGGITAAFGWGRLTGLDNAKAQLEGMGYSAKEVESITGEVSDAIQGGMMTMAEGTATAAGAMAAGVEQGDELARYLQLVDAAAVGANKPVNEMAMIFNRVQGSGKLMTQELNMIEDGMPGFSQTMADHLSMGMDEFREAVSAGEVTSNDFLDVMDDFAGGMAEAFSGTWQGMVANTKAWIGIIGENLLGGVFEQSKESIAEFMDLLKSDSVQDWAVETGEKIGETFSNIVESVKSGIQWFMDLDSEQKKLIGTFAAVAVAAGPILTVLGGLTIFIGQVVSAIAPLFLGLGRLAGGFKTVMAGVKPFAVVFPKLASLFAVITGPIGITVAAIVGLGAAFILAYNKSETFRDFIAGLGERFTSAWESVKIFGDNVKTAFEGIFAMFSGDVMGGMDLLRSIGLSDETIVRVMGAVETIKGAFRNLKVQLGLALGAITGFAQDTFAKIRNFWATDGEQVVQAATNGFNLISSVVSAVMPVITSVVRIGFNVVSTVIGTAMRLALSIVKMIWENIKGVINGGLNIIMGLVKTFSGLFTGDFSKMWEGVKQIFSGAIQLIWNGFQLLFWGRIIRGVGSLVKTFSGSIRGLWQSVVGFFQNMFQGAVQRVTNLRTSAVSIVSNLNTRINGIVSRLVSTVLNFFGNLLSRGASIFNNLRTSLTTTVGNLRMGITNRISGMVQSVINFFRNLMTRGLNIFSNLRTGVTNRISAMREGVVNGVSRMRDRALEIYRNLKEKAAGFLTDMVDGAKKLPGRIGDGIKNMASKAVSGIKSLGNSMVGKLGEVVNGVIGGLNSITSKIGISATIDKWDVPTFSTGTGQGSPTGNLTRNGKIAMDTLATVGDKGPGNGPGTRELVRYPNGKVGLYDNNATIFAPKGTTIFSNKETEALLNQTPKFSEGTGFFGRIKEVASKAVDYITNPSKIFDDLVGAVFDGWGDMSGFALNIVKGVWNTIKDGMLGWITDRFSESTVGTKQSWMDYRMTTPYSPNAPVPGYPKAFNGGRHYGIDYATPIGVNITAPFAGTVKKQHDVGGGIVARLENGKAAQYFLHMSSVKPGTVGVGESVGKSGNSGLFTTGPHVHWQHEEPAFGRLTNKNTKNPLKQIKSHMLGGLALTDGLIDVHKGEYIINPNHPTEAMKLIALAGKAVAAKTKQTSQLPNPGGYGSDDTLEALKEIASNQQQQINQLTQGINILMQLLKKDTSIYMDNEKVGGILDERNAINASMRF